MRKTVFAIFAAFFSACANKTSVPGMELAVYEDPSGLFSCEGPADWRVHEHRTHKGFVQFFGPAGDAPFGASIGIHYVHPDNPGIFTPIDKYPALMSSGAVPRERLWRGQKVIEFDYLKKPFEIHGKVEPGMRKHLSVLIPAKTGYFVLDHSVNEKYHHETKHVFETVVNSFRPKD